MRIAYLSDAHFEFNNVYDFDTQLENIDLCILVGDIHSGVRGMEWAERLICPSIYVAGNHEFYGYNHSNLINMLKSRNGKCKFLENEEYYSYGIRFLGCTLWTNFLSKEESYIRNDFERYIKQLANVKKYDGSLNDFNHITNDRGTRFDSGDMLGLHKKSLEWLSERLRTPYEGITMVVTHHPPTYDALNPRFMNSDMNIMFHNHLNDLIIETQPDYWFFGHHHSDYDSKIGKTRLLSNQRGYRHFDRQGNLLQKEKEFEVKFLDI